MAREDAELASGRPVPDDESHTKLKPNGQQQDYIVLKPFERAKGYVRPLRYAYRHVGTPGPTFPLIDLTADQLERNADAGYVKFEPYPEGHHGSALGRHWTQAQLDHVGKGCGSPTTMAPSIAETYARNPHFYGGTFCVACGKHLPVGRDGEFVWEGTNERVGT